MIADNNLGPARFAEAGLAWKTVGEGDLRVEGFPWSGGSSGWRRLPDAAWRSEGVGETLRHVAAQPAGGIVRLETNSPVIGIRTRYGCMEESRQSPSAATKGFDVYAGKGAYCGNIAPEGPGLDFESSLRLPGTILRAYPDRREIAIYLPLQLPLERLEVGFLPQFGVWAASPRRRRIVFYGSSITQGFCASRPGLTYPARVCRALDAELVNLGFGGNCRGQAAVARAIATLPMDAFVYDYDHNASGVDELSERHEPFLREILSARPWLPVLVLSSPNFHNDPAFFSPRRATIEATCRTTTKDGYTVRFLPGDVFWSKTDECTVDRLHPNDDGFARMAVRVGEILADMMPSLPPRPET